MLAPWNLFAPHAGRQLAFFLDRAGPDSWSFSGSDPSALLIVESSGAVLEIESGVSSPRRSDCDPIDAIEHFVEQHQSCVRAEPFTDNIVLPRVVGHLSYELGRYTEPVKLGGLDPTGLPLTILARYDQFDAWHPRFGMRRNIRFRDALATASPLSLDSLPSPDVPGSEDPNGRHGPDDCAGPEYRHGFERIVEAIRTGEIYQANLSRRITFPWPVEAVTAYRQLRVRQPVPQGAFLGLHHWEILSNSPETFLLVNGDSVTTLPIKGTRPRGTTADEDRRARIALQSDPKELAEHIMIVDLERNDLGRVCRTGSVAVERRAYVQSFRTLHHLVSEVRGRLREECGLADLLRAAFPGGSITGAPKIRAMQIIDEVETGGRGVYTGAIGSFNGPRSVNLNIAIRTAVAAAGRLTYCTGGGIVADSGLQDEWDETVTKARAFLEVTGLRTPANQERAS